VVRCKARFKGDRFVELADGFLNPPVAKRRFAALVVRAPLRGRLRQERQREDESKPPHGQLTRMMRAALSQKIFFCTAGEASFFIIAI